MRHIAYYVVRDVVRGANCSYPAGRTLLREVFQYPEDARRVVAEYNAHCQVPGVCYLVLPHDEEVLVEADHYENVRDTIPVMVYPSAFRQESFYVAGAATGTLLATTAEFDNSMPTRYFPNEDAAREYVRGLPQPCRRYHFVN